VLTSCQMNVSSSFHGGSLSRNIHHILEPLELPSHLCNIECVLNEMNQHRLTMSHHARFVRISHERKSFYNIKPSSSHIGTSVLMQVPSMIDVFTIESIVEAIKITQQFLFSSMLREVKVGLLVQCRCFLIHECQCG
jgi:hypothetical protein